MSDEKDIKKRGSSLLSVPHTEASRIALQSRTDNARAHADMNYIQHPYETLATEVAPERVQP